MANTKSGYTTAKDGNYKIYLITNIHNSKKYVGHTLYSVEARWSNHCSAALTSNAQSRFYHAIRKYGKAGFIVETLKSFNGTREYAHEVEKEYIKKYNSFSKYGYNANDGGSGGWVVKDKQKWQETRKGLFAGAGNSNYSGLTDDDLLELLYNCYIKFGCINNKASTAYLTENNYPKYLRPIRFSNFTGTNVVRRTKAFANKYKLQPNEFLNYRGLRAYEKYENN